MSASSMAHVAFFECSLNLCGGGVGVEVGVGVGGDIVGVGIIELTSNVIVITSMEVNVTGSIVCPSENETMDQVEKTVMIYAKEMEMNWTDLAIGYKY